MYPSPINRALCSAGITAAGSFTDVLPTVSRDANSSRVSMCDLGAIIRVWRRSAIVAWSTLLRSTNNLVVNAMHCGGEVLVNELGCTVADDDIAIGRRR
jgi:hypothetical protein